MTGRDLTAAIDSELGAAHTAPRWLVEIQFDSGPFRVWNGVGNLSALGETWTGVGRLGAIRPIRETQETVATGVEMTVRVIPSTEFPDAPDAVLNIAQAEDFQQRPCTIYMAMMDTATGALIADPFQRFNGYVDIMEDAELPGEALIRVFAESRLIDLERPRRRTYTPEDQKALYPGDTFFDEVAAIQNREIRLE